ncbi:unnamed protein product [marine sediment metagenome]|uniref:Uncharacterized protein n=1 Tax=marine sediment metagenome TaxID=412755 RepID=X1JBV4_9ZZZZ
MKWPKNIRGIGGSGAEVFPDPAANIVYADVRLGEQGTGAELSPEGALQFAGALKEAARIVREAKKGGK